MPGVSQNADLISALTGWELLKVGESVINLQRLFNIREGFGRNDDLIPERLGKICLVNGYPQDIEYKLSEEDEVKILTVIGRS